MDNLSMKEYFLLYECDEIQWMLTIFTVLSPFPNLRRTRQSHAGIHSSSRSVICVFFLGGRDILHAVSHEV